MSLDWLRSQFGSFPMDGWRYRQLQHFIKSLPFPVRPPSSLTLFEKLCKSEDPISHSISLLYEMLQSAESQNKPTYIREWERDLGHTFTEVQLNNLYRLTHKSSIDTKTQENCFKLLTRWYKVPTKLAKIYPTASEACWRGCGLRGTFLHIWWECPRLRPFWLDVRAQIKAILDVDLPDSPLEFLLHVPSTPLSQYRKSILPHLLNAARRLIPVHWKSTHIPGRTEWMGLIDSVMAVEEWMAKCKDKFDKFYAIWATWIHYKSKDRASPLQVSPGAASCRSDIVGAAF